MGCQLQKKEGGGRSQCSRGAGLACGLKRKGWGHTNAQSPQQRKHTTHTPHHNLFGKPVTETPPPQLRGSPLCPKWPEVNGFLAISGCFLPTSGGGVGALCSGVLVLNSSAGRPTDFPSKMTISGGGVVLLHNPPQNRKLKCAFIHNEPF